MDGWIRLLGNCNLNGDALALIIYLVHSVNMLLIRDILEENQRRYP